MMCVICEKEKQTYSGIKGKIVCKDCIESSFWYQDLAKKMDYQSDNIQHLKQDIIKLLV